MGTSSEGRGSEHGDPESNEHVDSPPPPLPPIPWKYVGFETVQSLVRKLNPRNTITGNDWRMLASKLGFNIDDIEWMESEKHFSNTEILLREYNKRPGNCVQEVLIALEEMHRADCVEAIKDALPTISEAWQRGPEGNALHLAETRDFHSLSGPGGHPAYSSGHHNYQQHPVCQPPGPANSLCGCGHSYSSCLFNNHNSHLGGNIPSAPPSMDYLHGPPTFSYHHSHPSSLPSLTQPMAMCPSSVQHSICGKIVNSSQHHRPGLNAGSPHGICSSSHPVNQCYDVRMECKAVSSCGNMQQFNSGLPSCNCRHNDAGMGPSSHPGVNRLHDNSTPYSNNNSNSTPNNSNNNYSHRVPHNSRQKVRRQISDDRSANQMWPGDKRFRATAGTNNQMMEVEYGDAGFENFQFGNPTAQGKPSMSATKFNAQGTRRHEDIYARALNGRPDKFDPQRSGDNLNWPHRSMESDKLANQRSQSGSPGFTNMSIGVVKTEQLSPSSQGETGGDPTDRVPESKTSLECLESLSVVPDHIKPTPEYTTVIAEQKIEAERGSKKDKDSLDSTSSTSSSSSGSKGRPSSTFPMRVKRDKVTASGAVEELSGLNNLKISKKSTSMPKDLKPQTYRKAFRYIRVFVTYSYDNKAHCKQVLSLCKFLEANSFACCVDETEDVSDGSSHSLEMAEWCRKKFSEADFILVCMSPGYLEAISRKTPDPTERRRLHTQQIYELMTSEFLNKSQQACPSSFPSARFIPLLFGDMAQTDLPPCMKRSPSYKWPSQYMDLAWMLSKPHERIKTGSHSSESQFENGDVDHDISDDF